MLLGFDIGGTFTDFVLLDEASGRLRVHKQLTTARDPAEGVLDGVRRLLADAQAAPAEVGLVIHGTTLVTNAILERKGARVGLLTTRGFRDILAMGIEQRYDVYDLFLTFPEPLVPRVWRREIDERTTADGTIRRAVDRAQVQTVVSALLAEGVESLAVSLLHAYREPANERAALEAVRERWPNLPVSLSSEVMPEVREFERTSTCVANAYVQPLVRRYLERLRTGLENVGCGARFFLMQSSGGTTSVETAERFPIRLLESGPAGGALAAAFYGEGVGLRSLLSFDMGGTTAKACLIEEGQPGLASSLEVGRVHRFKRGSGLPVKVPVVDLIEIGAGGGSIARINELGLMVVGPESAGAEPGPACYGLGGDQPTVTDANLVLGYLDPDYFLGGRIRLNVEAARRAIETYLARPLGLSLVEAAWGIHSIVNENMAAAARMHILEKGRDPRAFALLAFGGAGPGHACRLARILHLPRVVCPLAAGATSALGFLVAPVSFDFARSYPTLLRDADWGEIEGLYGEMLEVALRSIGAAGVVPEQARVERSVDMRYAGQVHELSVPMPEGALGAASHDVLLESFERQYLHLYHHLVPNLPPQALTWRLRVSGPRPDVSLTGITGVAAGGGPALKGRRPIYLPERRDYATADVYDRYALRPGDELVGPAIVEERESTAVVGPGDRARVDQFLNLVIDVAVR